MFGNVKRIIAIVMAMVLVLSLAGCTKVVYEGSSAEIEYVTQQVIVDGSTGNDTQTGNNNNQQGGTTNKPNGQQGGSTTNKDGTINDGVNPEDYRGKTIKFAATIDPKNDESGPVVEAFEKKYGIKVEIVQSDQSNYPNQLSGWIAAGNAPDIARSNGDFPMAMAYLQSLDAAKLDYNEEIWDKGMFKLTTFGGSPYLCDTVGNIWKELDIVLYNKSILKRANCYTPEQYDEAGKWTWDAYFEIARKVKATLGTEAGCSFISRDGVMHAMGANVFELDNGTFTNGFKNDQAVKSMTKFAEAWKEGLISWESVGDFSQNKIGIITTYSWSLKKTGFFKDFNWNDIGYYYLPKNDVSDKNYPTTCFLRGWGLCRGANEPVAAGIFLREYLDVNNYDTTETFISEEAETFFFEATDYEYEDLNVYYTYCGYTQELAGFNYMDEIWAVMGYDPAQIPAKMSSISGLIDKGCKNFNDFTKKNTGLR
ncbi:MAG: extracellular solute-binding protein [Ruminococcaceae bacterium]|nr:extracellular solute-binding protein [Oscillospiraceae bacterium]